MDFIKRNGNTYKSLYSKITKSNKQSLHEKDLDFLTF